MALFLLTSLYMSETDWHSRATFELIRWRIYFLVMNSYTITKAKTAPSAPFGWDAPEWNAIPALTIGNFLPESSEHHPVTRVKLQYDAHNCYLLFQVTDRYVRSVRTTFGSDVWNDSCIEWFVKPIVDKGYFNFEINAGGVLHCSYVEDPKRIDGKLKKCTLLSKEQGAALTTYPSLPHVVNPEISDQLLWTMGFTVPFSLLEEYVGPLTIGDTATWRANFNKCADECSHPHWATWNPISEKNFHRPSEFGLLHFA